MSTWILILTLAYGSSSGGPGLHSVPGFNTQAACMSAGKAWLSQVSVFDHDVSGRVRGVALCVEQPAPPTNLDRLLQRKAPPA